MEAVSPTDVLLDDAPRRERAKERLYVICQTAGWGIFLLMQLLFMRIFWTRRPPTEEQQVTDVCINVMVLLMGLLISHYTRVLAMRWGWKRLGWAGAVAAGARSEFRAVAAVVADRLRLHALPDRAAATLRTQRVGLDRRERSQRRADVRRLVGGLSALSPV
jgi:hypothetical protein